jgi:Fe-S cluster assembly iron-binding protein IscA
MLVVGTTMDYEEGDTQSKFVFYNPNVTHVCGCGSSFSVDSGHQPKE